MTHLGTMDNDIRNIIRKYIDTVMSKSILEDKDIKTLEVANKMISIFAERDSRMPRRTGMEEKSDAVLEDLFEDDENV